MTSICDKNNLPLRTDFSSQSIQIEINLIIKNMILPLIDTLNEPVQSIIRNPGLIIVICFITIKVSYLLPVTREMDVNDIVICYTITQFIQSGKNTCLSCRRIRDRTHVFLLKTLLQ